MNIYQFETSFSGYYSYWMPYYLIDYNIFPELRPSPEEANQSDYAKMLRKEYWTDKPEQFGNDIETLKYVDKIKDLFSFGIEPIASIWTPLEIERIDDSDNSIYSSPPSSIQGDFSHCASLIGPPILSPRATEVFQQYFGNLLEYLPLKSNCGEFTAIKILNFFNAEDILDLKKSKLEWANQTKRQIENGYPRWLQEIREAYFIEQKLENVFFFRIIECMYKVFVTQPVVDIVEKNGLTGANFIKIAPLPDPNEIRKAMYEKAMKRRKKKRSIP